MRETKIYCDHCGKLLDEIHDYVELEVGIYESIETDLCSECYEELEKNINAFCKKGAKEQK